MPSPFPGMNPYLEQPYAWRDFHESFCMAIREAVVPQVRPRYFVKLDEHVYLHERSADERRPLGRGDVTFAAGLGRPGGAPRGIGAVAAAAYGSVLLAVDEERLVFVEIRDRETREIVTVLELLDPSPPADSSSTPPQPASAATPSAAASAVTAYFVVLFM